MGNTLPDMEMGSGGEEESPDLCLKYNSWERSWHGKSWQCKMDSVIWKYMNWFLGHICEYVT